MTSTAPWCDVHTLEEHRPLIRLGDLSLDVSEEGVTALRETLHLGLRQEALQTGRRAGRLSPRSFSTSWRSNRSGSSRGLSGSTKAQV